MNCKSLFSFFIALGASYAALAQNSDVMLQGFNWNSATNTTGWYNVVNSKVSEMKLAGINTVWLPPCSKSAAREGYLPSELYNLSSSYGTQAQLQTLTQNLHTNGMKALADIVINHRVGSMGWADFQNPTWGCWAVCSNDEWTGRCGNNDTGDGYGPARDIDHTNTQVQNDLIAWMNWLKNTIGFDGWRYDYVRGFNASYIKQYNTATNPYFSVGEMWDPNRQIVQNWVDAAQQSSTAFDFPTKGILQDALNNNNLGALSINGQAPGLIGWSPCKAVTFIDNHDTGSSQNHWPFPGDKVMQGYAYILTHPGIPMVFWDHYFDWGLKTEINALIKVRKDNALHCGSSLSIQTAQSNLYAAIIDGKVAMKIGTGNWSPSGTGWTLKASGNNYAVWDKSTTDTTPPVVVANPDSQTFTASLNVTLTGTDNSGIAPTIYYTTDGSTPTMSSPSSVGTKAFTFTNTTTLKYFAKDFAGNSSAINTKTYTITNPAPVVIITPCGPFNPSVTVTITANDNSGIAPTIYYTTNGSTPTTASTSAVGTVSLTFTATTTLKVFSVDNQGLASAIQSCTYTNSNQPPVITFTPPSRDFSYSLGVTVSATDDSGIAPTLFYTTDGTIPTTASLSATGTKSFTFMSTKTVKVIARDNQGLLSTVRSETYTLLPNQAPSVITNQPCGQNFPNTISLTLTGSDDSGIAPTIYYTTNGTTPTTSSTSATGSVSLTLSNTTTVKYFARDNQGLSSAVQTCTYTKSNGFTVYFKRPSNWSTANNPYIHYWGALPAGALANCTWPCVPMQTHTNGWFKYPFTVTSTNLLFHDNAGKQTADLSRNADGWYMNSAWSNTEPATVINYVMDGSLDANIPTIDANAGSNLYAHYSGGKLYVGTQGGGSLGNKDVFIFVSSNPTTLTAAPWAKSGQVPAGCKVLSNEGTNGWAGWSGTVGADQTRQSTNFLEGVLDVAAEFGTATQLYIAVGVYGTNNNDALFRQVPAAVTANGTIEVNEMKLFPLTTTAAALLPNQGINTTTNLDLVIDQKNNGVTLYQNIPNPFDNQTAITFELQENSTVKLSVFDMMGREVEVLQNGTLSAGGHQFVFEAGSLSKGTYIYVLETNGKKLYQKMILK